MTEEEWLAATDPIAMIGFLSPDSSERKLHLFLCAFCSMLLQPGDRNPSLLRKFVMRWVDYASPWRNLVAWAEAYADGEATYGELQKAWIKTQDLQYPIHLVCLPDEMDAAQAVMLLIRWSRKNEPSHRLWRRYQTDILRDLFGNPFRPATIAPEWISPNVQAIARPIYDERAYDRLPILGDALEDAGCSSTEILNHCRQPGNHVRGCWLVDQLLEIE